MRKKQYLVFIIFQTFILIVSLVGGACIGGLGLIENHKNAIYDHVTVEHMAIGGKSYAEALDYINQYYLKPLLTQPIILINEEEQIQMTAGDFYKPVDVEKLLEHIQQDMNQLNNIEKLKFLTSKNKKDYDLTLELDLEKVEGLAKKMSLSTDRESREASIKIDNANTIKVTPHQSNRKLDQKRFTKALAEGLQTHEPLSLDLNRFVEEIPPTQTTEVISQIDTIIASYSSKVSGGEDRETNVRIASEAINGIVLLPGEIFSFNDRVGDSTEDKGYKAAPIIVNKQVELGLGGGVCQVSSVLYNAVLRTGLDSVARQPHSLPLSYVPKGLDATISYDVIDYKFKNTFDYPLYIQSYLKDHEVYVQIYSNVSLKGPIYKLKSETYEVIPSPVKYIKDATLPEGQKLLTQQGRLGYKVKVTREKYEEDKLVQTEMISKDVYKPSTTYYKIGTKKNNEQ